MPVETLKAYFSSVSFPDAPDKEKCEQTTVPLRGFLVRTCFLRIFGSTEEWPWMTPKLILELYSRAKWRVRICIKWGVVTGENGCKRDRMLVGGISTAGKKTTPIHPFLTQITRPSLFFLHLQTQNVRVHFGKSCSPKHVRRVENTVITAICV